MASLKKILMIAENAKNHANTVIVHGSTQIDNNLLPQKDFLVLDDGITQTRSLLMEKIELKLKGLYSLEVDFPIAYYETKIALIEKYSLGNCGELAFLALDYVINNTNINAEIYDIQHISDINNTETKKRGDHRFLVLNRKPDSDPYKPETWGNAVICDPWSKKVYPAADYLKELKNFRRKKIQNVKKNTTEDINNKEFRLVPAHYKNDNTKSAYYNITFPYNTAYLRTIRNVDYLKNNFLIYINHLLSILSQFNTRLTKRTEKLISKHGDSDKKVIILTKKIAAVNKQIKNLLKIAKSVAVNNFSKKNYRSLRKYLTDLFTTAYHDTILTIKFSSSDLTDLASHRNHFNFFNMKIGTLKAVKEATNEVNVSLLSTQKKLSRL